jgi:hypothetical protein
MDGALSIAERREMNIHLRDCPKCSSDYEMLSLARNAVKRLPMQTPPADLDARLHLIAMRESARRTGELAGRTPLGFAWEAMRIRIENVMRPLAIPFAGGLVSTLVLFSMLAPTYPRKAARSLQQDVPTVFYQEPTVKSVAPFAFSEEDFLIEVTLDETGQVIGYTFPEGQVDPVLRREIESTLLFARFTPALAFGQPTAGKIRLSFRRAFIDVKG